MVRGAAAACGVKLLPAASRGAWCRGLELQFHLGKGVGEMHRLIAVMRDHVHSTFAGEVLECRVPYERCQGERWPGRFVYVVENPADWAEFVDATEDAASTARAAFMACE